MSVEITDIPTSFPKRYKILVRHIFARVLLFFSCVSLLIPSAPRAESPAEGQLEITLHLNPADTDAFQPSYQTVIWLETLEGDYVRSLFVSEYMSYGGFMLPEVCPRWHAKSNWEQNYEEEMDAVTSATPGLNETVLTFDCAKLEISPGVYRYCVQTHIVEDYNILYSGEIRIGGEENASAAEVTYTPSEHPDALKVLTAVSAKYYD